jgi:hypothetical protein
MGESAERLFTIDKHGSVSIAEVKSEYDVCFIQDGWQPIKERKVCVHCNIECSPAYYDKSAKLEYILEKVVPVTYIWLCEACGAKYLALEELNVPLTNSFFYEKVLNALGYIKL